MKFKFLIHFLFLLISNQIFGQDSMSDLEVRYYMKYIPDSLKRSNFVEVNDMILLLNSKESTYYSEDTKNYYDFLYKGISTMSNGKITLPSLPPLPKVKGTVYRKDSKILVTIPVGQYLYEFEEPNLEWKLLNEENIVNGISCKLATAITDTGDTFFAWYSSSYPFSEGPFRFKGLPGLVIKVWNKTNTIELSTTSIKKLSLPIEKFNLNRIIKLKSKEQFLQARTAYNNEPNSQDKMFNNIVIKDTNTGEVIKQNAKKKITSNIFLD